MQWRDLLEAPSRLAVMLTDAQVHDSKVFEELVDTVETCQESEGTTREASREAPHGQRLRLSALTKVSAQQGHKGEDSKTRRRDHREVGSLPLDRRADLRLAFLLPKADNWLRTKGRHARGVPGAGLRPCLL